MKGKGRRSKAKESGLDCRASAAGLARTFSFTSCSCLGDRLRSCRTAVLPSRRLTHPTSPANKPTDCYSINSSSTTNWRTKSCVTLIPQPPVLRPSALAPFRRPLETRRDIAFRKRSADPHRYSLRRKDTRKMEINVLEDSSRKSGRGCKTVSLNQLVTAALGNALSNSEQATRDRDKRTFQEEMHVFVCEASSFNQK